jgi:predicted acetyltransferase
MLKLIFPNKSHKDKWEKLKTEWTVWLKMPSSFFKYDTFESFIDGINKDIVWVEWKVPSHMYFMIDDEVKNEIIWIIQIRHSINHPNLIEDWWHIWYWIAPKYRRKWYWSKMLKLALHKFKELWLDIDKALITCNLDNIGSAKVIENNGWIFERVTNSWEKKRYWISL